MRFLNKVAIITGGGTGIGRATAINFADEGAKVVVAGRREEPLKGVVEEIVNNHKNGEATYLPIDVGNPKDVRQLVAKAVKDYGKLDIMINNAGINLAGLLTDTTDEELDNVLNINVKGTFFGMRESIKQFKKQGSGGSVINISSMSGLLGHPTRTAYCGTKAAVINMTRCAAMEYAEDNIRVNVICPGVIDTPMVQWHMERDPEAVKGYIQSIPMKRMGTSEEIAHIILFLASEEASYITGASLAADGAFTAGK